MNIVLIVGLLITVLTGIPVLMQLRKHPPGLTVVFLAEMWVLAFAVGLLGRAVAARELAGTVSRLGL